MSRSVAHEQRNDAFREALVNPLDFAASALPTATQVTNVAKELGVHHDVEQIFDDQEAPRIHWLGNVQARKVLLYFHGTFVSSASVTDELSR